MRWCSFVHNGQPDFGRVYPDGVAPMREATCTESLSACIAAGKLDCAAPSERVALEGLYFLPVIPEPRKIICVGLNYRSHADETGAEVSDYPVIFIRFSDSQTGHRQPLIKPRESEQLDWEGELAVIIGLAGRRIPREAALSHVIGYAPYNDGSARDWQRHTRQFSPGKNFPGTGAFGPWMTEAAAVPDPHGLLLTTRVNGEVVQQASTADLIFPIDVLIAYISAFTPLSPGDVIVTGTPAGIGARQTPPRFLRAGDHVEVEIDGLGKLENTVVEESLGVMG